MPTDARKNSFKGFYFCWYEPSSVAGATKVKSQLIPFFEHNNNDAF